ncbi:MAG: ribonuclease H-like domain-containing protein [Nanoarchaeota archaeon]|nr:ribonuclease H-like domain-containing protein [Nanoarchaeota archaeon]MBU1631820.1 ribonuclease H-like domain-containing protein [Nanoarchaeota archaeon]MBU1875611.1 ribonuclease H-like domain-containing protein [Nanoarchaeota archaeon]
MIKNSFIFLEKISNKKERNIWKQGIKDWHDFLNVENVKGISKEKKYYYDRKIKEAQNALLKEELSYFIRKLPKIETWRLYDYFKDECGFLDIEIDSYGKTILVGISDYYNANFFVKGSNLEKDILEKELSKYKLIITFNGSSFDLPKLKKQFGLKINIPHIDLKHLCVNLGLKGGLKEVEKILDIKRPQHLNGNPVDLWKAFHASGDKEWLDLLIAYNNEDIENLKAIMKFVYKKNKEKLNG